MSESKQTPPAIIPGYILQNEEISRPRKLLLGIVNTLSNNSNGYCSASNATLSDWLGIPKGTISPWLSDLIKKGYLKREIIRDGDEVKERHLWLPESKEAANNDTPLKSQEGDVEKSRDPSLGKSRVNKQESDKDLDKQDNSSTNVDESQDSEDKNLKEMHKSPPNSECSEWTKKDIVKNYYYWLYQTTDIPKQPSNWGTAMKLAGDLQDKYAIKSIDGATQYFFKMKDSRFRSKFKTPIGDIHNIMGEYLEWANRKQEEQSFRNERERIMAELEDESDDLEFTKADLGGVLNANS